MGFSRYHESSRCVFEADTLNSSSDNLFCHTLGHLLSVSNINGYVFFCSHLICTIESCSDIPRYPFRLSTYGLPCGIQIHRQKQYWLENRELPAERIRILGLWILDSESETAKLTHSKLYCNLKPSGKNRAREVRPLSDSSLNPFAQSNERWKIPVPSHSL